MTRVSEGFEGSTQGTTISTSNTVFTTVTLSGSTAIFDTASKLLGSFGAKLVHSSSTGFMQYLWGSNQTNQYVRMYVKMSVVAASGQDIIGNVLSGATNRAQLTWTSAGKFNLRSPATLQASGANVYTNTWVRLEWDLVGTVQTLRIFSGANLYGSTPDETIGGGAGSITVSGFDRIRIGLTTAASYTQLIDGVEIDSVATPGPAADPSGGVAADVYVWDGTTMIASDIYVWNGTSLVASDVSAIA